MATGWLTDRNTPVMPFYLDGVEYHAVLDTGYTGGLLLPEWWVPSPGAFVVRPGVFDLPDGSQLELDIYWCDIVIDGVSVGVEISYCGDREILMGADVLQYFLLTIDYPAGTVTLAPPSAPSD